MLFVTFQTGDSLYALAAEEIIEILPLVEMRRLRDAPPAIAGWFGYRGAYAPVIDLGMAERSEPAERRMSTRILMVRYAVGGRMLVLGLMAEKATETLRCDPAAFAPFAASRQGLVERIDVQRLVPEALATWLLDHDLEAAA